MALTAGVYLVGITLIAVLTPTEHPSWAMAYLGGLWILILMPQTWLWVGIWRSAARTTRDTGHSLWPNAARCAVVIGGLYTAGLFLEGDYGVRAFPALAEAVQDQKESSVYTVRPLRNGSELEISGGIGPGISDALRAQLRANPNARVVHLNSPGGMVFEAKKLRDLIRERHLVTDTSTGCASACTIAFLGGASRLLNAEARLGFHQPKIPVLRGSALKATLQAEEEYLVTCGVTRAFAHKVMLTPQDAQWYPTPAELLDAHVITGTKRGDDLRLAEINGSLDDTPVQASRIHEREVEREVAEILKAQDLRKPAAERMNALQSLQPRTDPGRMGKKVAELRIQFESQLEMLGRTPPSGWRFQSPEQITHEIAVCERELEIHERWRSATLEAVSVWRQSPRLPKFDVSVLAAAETEIDGKLPLEIAKRAETVNADKALLSFLFDTWGEYDSRGGRFSSASRLWVEKFDSLAEKSARLTRDYDSDVLKRRADLSLKDLSGSIAPPLRPAGLKAVNMENDVPRVKAVGPFIEYRVTPDVTSVHLGETVTLHFEMITQADLLGFKYVDFPLFEGCSSRTLEAPSRPEPRRGIVDGRMVSRYTLLKLELRPLHVGHVTIPVSRVRTSVKEGDRAPLNINLSSKTVTVRVLPPQPD